MFLHLLDGNVGSKAKFLEIVGQHLAKFSDIVGWVAWHHRTSHFKDESFLNFLFLVVFDFATTLPFLKLPDWEVSAEI